MTSIRIEKLSRHHSVEEFDCGQPALDRFLVKFALTSQFSGASRTYVVLAHDRVVGYHSLVVGEVAYVDAPERLTKGMARHPVPIMLIARIAVDRAWQSKGIGAALLKDAMKRTIEAAEIAGIRALAVHAKDDSARQFYEHFNFIASPVEPLHLYMLLKDVHRATGES